MLDGFGEAATAQAPLRVDGSTPVTPPPARLLHSAASSPLTSLLSGLVVGLVALVVPMGWVVGRIRLGRQSANLVAVMEQSPTPPEHR